MRDNFDILCEKSIRNAVAKLTEEQEVPPVTGQDIVNIFKTKDWNPAAFEYDGGDSVDGVIYIVKGEKFEVEIHCEANVRFHINPYDPGDYWTPPYGGDAEWDDRDITSVQATCNNVEIPLTDEEQTYIASEIEDSVLTDDLLEYLADKYEPEEPEYDQDLYRD